MTVCLFMPNISHMALSSKLIFSMLKLPIAPRLLLLPFFLIHHHLDHTSSLNSPRFLLTMPPMTPAIHEGVRHAESLIDIYPKHFPNIEAAKAYVVQTCGLDLADVDSDKIAFLVGIKAFQAGEFYLDLAPPNRKVLRGM